MLNKTKLKMLFNSFWDIFGLYGLNLENLQFVYLFI